MGWTATGRLTSWRYWKSSTGIWAWGWLPAFRFPFPRQPSAGQCRTNPKKRPKSQSSPTSSGNRSFLLLNWCTGSNTASRPNCWSITRSARSGNTTAKRQRANRTPTLHRWQNPCTATRANSTSSCTARSPRPASSTAAASARTTVSGWNNCQPKATRYSSRAARKTCFRWRRMVFTLSASTAKRLLSRQRWFIG